MTLDNLLEIRLQGSVAREDEIQNVSDMDFLCILKNNTDRSKPKALENQEKVLSRMCPELTKVDLDIANEKQIDDNRDYELLIQTDSLCVYGEDRYTRRCVEISGEELANLWNLNLENTLRSYRRLAVDAESNEHAGQYVKFIGKDLLKACRPKLMREKEIFSRTVLGTHGDLCEAYPKYSTLFDSLLDFYLKGKAKRERALEVIDAVDGAKPELM